MRLLAKNPADRPPTAEVVVEAIKSIERELLAERQKAELSSATPPPADVGSRKLAQSAIAGEPGAPRPAAKARSVRRALAIAAAVVLLGIAVVAIGGVMLSRPCQDGRGGSSGADCRRRDRTASCGSGAQPTSEPARSHRTAESHGAAGRNQGTGQ